MFQGFGGRVSTAGGLQSSQAAAALCAEGEQCVASESLIRKPRKYHQAFKILFVCEADPLDCDVVPFVVYVEKMNK